MDLNFFHSLQCSISNLIHCGGSVAKKKMKKSPGSRRKFNLANLVTIQSLSWHHAAPLALLNAAYLRQQRIYIPAVGTKGPLSSTDTVTMLISCLFLLDPLALLFSKKIQFLASHRHVEEDIGE